MEVSLDGDAVGRNYCQTITRPEAIEKRSDFGEGRNIQTASWAEARVSAQTLDGRRKSALRGATNAVGMTASTLREMVVKVVRVKVRVESSKAALAQQLSQRQSGLGVLVERVEAMM
jgi:hypothetical protein